MSQTLSQDAAAVEAAWQIHAAQMEWTARVDSKASTALAIQSAALAAVAFLSDGDQVLGHLGGIERVIFWLGSSLLAASVVCVSFVVRPHLRTKHLADEAPDNFIFFGHLKYWKYEALESRLGEGAVLTTLAKQIVEMAKVAWFKHRLLQASMSGALIGTGLVALAGFMD